MKCSRAEYLIASLVNGDISEMAEESLRGHIDACPRCSTIYETQLAIEAELKGLEAPLPDADFAKRMARLATRIPPVAPRFRLRDVVSWFGLESIIGISVAMIVGITWAILGIEFTRLIERGLECLSGLDIASYGGLSGIVMMSVIILCIAMVGICRFVRVF